MAALHGVDNMTAYTVSDTHTGREYGVRRLPSDIDACVPLSLLRCLLSVAGILLVLTDIPRTGLTINLFAHLPKVAPGTAMYYGPYAYPVVHLNRTGCSQSNGACDDSNISAYAGEEHVDSVDVWSYKFDSLSIPTRALAQQLNVSSYPPCVFYKSACETSTLAPSTTFSMVSDLMAAMERRYFTDASLRDIPVVFETTNKWADRLHHIVVGRAGYRVDRRIHSVHYFSTRASLRTGERLGVEVCQARGPTDRHSPMVCSLTARWWSDHPTRGAGTQIPIEESISLRFAALQQRYPNSHLEMAMITTRSLIHSRRVAFLPAVYYLSDNIEVTTLIRGLRCLPGQPCRVEFVDDYRYERASVETSSDEIMFITGSLRAVSQTYVWVRVLLVVYISYHARLSESQHRAKSPSHKLAVVMLTFVRVPSHVLIYGSWLPIVAYSAAHFMDCGLVHLISENFWSTANGFLDFKLFDFIVVASIQMRNIWLIAFVWKCVTTGYSAVFQQRNRAWQPQNGLLAFRGVFVGMISFLTIFSFLRALHFRNAEVTSFFETPRHAGFANQLFPPLSSGVSDFGHFVDAKAVVVASAIVCGAAFTAQTLIGVFSKSATTFFTCHNFYVPLSAGKLYPQSALNVFWYIHLIAPRPTRSGGVTVSPMMTRPASVSQRLRSMSSKAFTAVIPLPLHTPRGPRFCGVCHFVSTPLHWRSTQGCPRHESPFTPGARSIEVQSMVRLVNIGMLSDPIVFLRLRVLGKPLYLYRVPRSGSQPRVHGPDVDLLAHSSSGTDDTYILLPDELSRLGSQDQHSERSDWQLVAVVDSRRVPWTLLVDCG